MSHEYGRIIIRNARTFRDTKSAGLDYIAAPDGATERRIDRWILWMTLACLPLCLYQFLQRF